MRVVRGVFKRSLMVAAGVLAVAVSFAPQSAQAYETEIPQAGGIFLEVSRTGAGNGLHAPETYVDLFWQGNPGIVEIYDGTFCGSSGIDATGTAPSNCSAPSIAQTTYFDFTTINHSTGSPVGTTYRTNSKDYAANGWTEVNLSGKGLGNVDGDTDNKHFVSLRVKWADTSNTLGGVNAFKVRLKPGTFSPGDGLVYAVRNENQWPLAIQRRPLDHTAPYTHDNFSFAFAPGCEPTSAELSGPLKWFDADWGQGNQSGDISWTLREYNTDNQPTGYEVSAANAQVGGAGANSQYNGIAWKKGHKYIWTWYHVDSRNGLQVFFPFDQYNFDRKCPGRISGRKVIKNADGTVNTTDVNPVSGINVRFNRISDGSIMYQTTDNPYNAPVNNFKVPIGVPMRADTTGALPAGYTYAGFTVCNFTQEPTCDHKTKPLNPATSRDITLNVAETHASIWWWYTPPGLDSATCTISPNPVSVTAGQNFTATITATNSGQTTWTAAAGYQMRQHPSPSGLWTSAIALSSTTAPNASVNFVMTGTAPQTPGNYAFNWSMAKGTAFFGTPCTGQVTVTGPIPKIGKVFASNLITAATEYVRDNFSFVFNLRAYIWPHTSTRASNNGASARYFWESGLYGTAVGDTTNGGPKYNLNSTDFTEINNSAESICPDSIRCRLPLNYVKYADNSALPTGSTTPDGNNWYSILNSNFGGSYSTRYGGIAGNVGTNVINNVEVSNIRIAANGLSSDSKNNNFQGGVGTGVLQLRDAQSLSNNYNSDGNSHYLPPASQGPRKVDGSGKVAWDNLRNPDLPNSGFSSNITSSSLEFPNTTGSPLNFSGDANNMLSIYDTVKQRTQQYGSSTVTSLLQDNEDGPNRGGRQYTATSEPASYTATLNKIDTANLRWDEYVDWTQTDDKGHYYTTKQTLNTGVARGNASYSTVTTQGVNTGSSVHDGTYTTYCSSYGWVNYGTSTNPSWSYECTGTSQYPNYTTCSSVSYNYGWTYTYNNIGYYTGSYESQYGWIRSDNIGGFTGYAPYGGSGTTSGSYFYPSHTPSWATVNNYWQSNAADMPSAADSYASGVNTGLTDKSATNLDYSQRRWIYDTSDPIYTNRYVYRNYQTPSFANGWYYLTSSACVYPNGSGVYNNGSTTATYYPSAYALTESSSSSPTGQVYGAYANGATYDGISDGSVDVGWAWQANQRRVRYQGTYTGHTRNLGSRCRVVADGCPQLFGVNGNGEAVKPDRGIAHIFNPTIQAANADIFGGRSVDSYFNSSSNSSAFIFSNGLIRNFTSSNNFQGYFNNPSQRTRTVFDNASGDPINFVFENYSTEIDGKATQTTTPPLSSLGNSNIYRTGPAGSTNLGNNLTVNGTVCGRGTIIVKGNLYINGDMGYCNAGNDRANLASVGFIVTGNVFISPGVQNIVGSYFVRGTVNTGTVLSDSGADRVNGDSGLTVRGLMVARSFNLQRQPLGVSLRNGVVPEQFIYDGRVVVSPPPGFTYLYSAPAAWNEGIPYTSSP